MNNKIIDNICKKNVLLHWVTKHPLYVADTLLSFNTLNLKEHLTDEFNKNTLNKNETGLRT